MNEVVLNYLALGVAVWCIYKIFILCRKIMRGRIEGRNKGGK